MNEKLLDKDLTTLNSFLSHSGRPGMKWGTFGASGATRWQSGAVYAKGMSNPNADKSWKEEKKAFKDRDKGRRDASFDYSVDAGISPYNMTRSTYLDNKKVDLMSQTRFSQRRPKELFSIAGKIAEKKGGMKASKEYYDEYMKTYESLSDRFKDRLIRPAKENSSAFIVDGKKKTINDYRAKKFLDEMPSDTEKKLKSLSIKADDTKDYRKQAAIYNELNEKMAPYENKFVKSHLPNNIASIIGDKSVYSNEVMNDLRKYDKAHTTDYENQVSALMISLNDAQVDRWLAPHWEEKLSK